MVITRFAPSPTGGLHIGSVRTILFNWLYAKHCNGKFRLRIEDTDIERSKLEYTENIYYTMQWLGLHWDDEVVFQLQNIKRHQQVAQKLLDEGKAYKCYCTKEELQAQREDATKERRTPKYERKCRQLSKIELEQNQDKPFAVRLKCPIVGTTEFIDLIQGPCVLQNEYLDDMILLRSDGTPTYMLAVVVDDHDMEITHVIRASEHLNNTYRQKQIYEACDWALPNFAHVSLIHGEDGAKLSKRHGASTLEEFIKMGFLKEAMLNYLIHLGWNKSQEEILSIDECIKLFDIKDVKSSPARFSMHKLLDINSIYINARSDEDLLNELKNFINKEKYDQNGWQRVLEGMQELKVRSQTLAQLDIMSEIYGFGEDYFGHIAKSDVIEYLIKEARNSPWEKDIGEITQWLNERIKNFGTTLKEIAPDLRYALTKSKVAPSIFEILKTLGPNIFASRLEKAIANQNS
jgi:glutamyl-tRNA synthetase